MGNGSDEWLSSSAAVRYDSFGWATLEAFQILAAEGWSARMYEVMQRTGSAMPALYYVCVFISGQYVLLNLTLAIMLDGSSAILMVCLRRARSLMVAGRDGLLREPARV